jgi:tRNA (uracil-5-)-methyltransferase TRM9
MEKMKESIVSQLAQINEVFYKRFGKAFAETRRRLQPGVERVLSEFVSDGDWLDLGCGSGTLGSLWFSHERTGSYEGLDFSPVLIAEAQKATADLPLQTDQRLCYTQTDVGRPGWQKACSRDYYDGVLMFAAMHHLPDHDRRLALLREIASLIKSGGYFIHSEWQFQRSPKLMTHVVPWSAVAIDPAELEEGDTLLDWRHTDVDRPGETGLRYVHLFSHEELSQLAGESGFTIRGEFDSDGASGNLSLYQVWQRG